ncbi:STAS domain-containing protein [Paenibacillus sp. HJGM_3]|uniref:STAS domain-containing protein n=1 Tax=Paenibacillus sp. HJGM_3 TaxID=3379816 RepID=UPI0038694AAD
MLNAIHTFNVTKQRTESAYIVSLAGELDLSVATDLVEELQPLIAQTDRAFVFDLRQLQYIDSTGIGIIVSILKSRAALQAPFAVRNVPPKIKRLFDLTGISRHLPQEPASTADEGAGRSS